ncbi:hypothetical protein AB0K20_26100 [Micromonospora matsumotoense]
MPQSRTLVEMLVELDIFQSVPVVQGGNPACRSNHCAGIRLP